MMQVSKTLITPSKSVQYWRICSRAFANLTKEDGLTPIFEPKYYKAKKDRSNPNEIYKVDKAHGARLERPSRRSPSRDLNFTPETWELHKSPWRRIRHLKSIHVSSPFQRLLVPDMASIAAVGAALSYYNSFLVEAVNQISIDGSAMAGATTAVGLLSGFRLNASYGRYDEGRKFWGEINNSSRDLAGNAMMWLETKEQKDRMIHLIKAFAVALHWHLNHKGGHYRISTHSPTFKEQKYAEFYGEMKDVFDGDTKNPDFIYICENYLKGTHLPLRISSSMRAIIADNVSDPIYNREMDEQVQRMVGCLGMAERVLRTPIPVCFTRHTSRLFFFWSNLIPLALYPAMGPLLTTPASLLVTYSVLGIEDIGVQLEEPFNILPLRQYSEGIADGCNNIRDSYVDQQKTTKKKLPINGEKASMNGGNKTSIPHKKRSEMLAAVNVRNKKHLEI